MLDLLVGDVVEDEELGLGAEVRDVGDPDLHQVPLGLLGDEAGIARVGLAEYRIGDRADQRQRRAACSTGR